MVTARRLQALWRLARTWDRIAAVVILLAVIGHVARIFGWRPLPGLVAATFAVLTLLLDISVIYFLVRSRRWFAVHVLWSLRNKLILAYVFIALVPVALLLALGGLVAYLANIEVAAHLLTDDINGRMEQVAQVNRQALALGQASASDRPLSLGAIDRAAPVQTLENAARSRLPGLTIDFAFVSPSPHGSSAARLITSGNRIWIESVAQATVAPDHAIQARARLPVSPDMLDGLAPELGPVSLVWNVTDTGVSQSMPGETTGTLVSAPVTSVSSRRRALPPRHGWLDFRINGVTTFDAVRLAGSDARQVSARVLAAFSVRPSSLERRLQSSLGEFGAPLVILLAIIALLFLVIELLALVAGVALTRTITNAVAQIYNATERVKARDFSHRISIARHDQLGALAESFNSMTASIENLLDEQRQRQRLENELAIAREVQTELFPRSLPSIPGLKLAAVCRAARIVSGDYYDCLQLGPQRVAVAVADISGKGISAALLMANLNAALRSLVTSDGLGAADTAVLAQRLNRHLLLNTSDDRYATLFFAIYDSATRILQYTNAGHLPPFFVVGDRIQRLDRGGPVIGLLDNCSYEQASIQVETGSLLVAYSDGMTEPENAYGEEFGAERLVTEVFRHRHSPPQRLCDQLIAAVEGWSAPAEPFDDQTVLVARME